MSAVDVDATRARLVEIASSPQGDLAEGALWIAAEEYPGLDVAAYLRRVDDLADEVRAAVAEPGDPASWRRGMVDRIFRVHGFRGNTENYDDPRNSFLNEVIDRGLGIPITLAVVYIAVGRRLALPVSGINAPGHFLLRHGTAVVDAFSGGEILAPEALVERLHRMGVPNPQAELVDLMSVPPDTRAILCRVLGNLKGLYLRRQDLPRALGVVERLVALRPEDPRELRDRGALLQRLECPQAAVRDLERYLELVDDDPDEGTIRAAIARLRGAAPSLH